VYDILGLILSKKAVEEYQEIYKMEFGIELSYSEAEEKGIKLLRIFAILCKSPNKVTQD
jgi:hypothetical protein